MNLIELHKKLISEFDDLFSKAASKRKELMNKVTTKYEPYGTCEWVDFERKTMFEAINSKRSELGKLPIDLDTFYRCETQACGHVDYQRKLVLYSVELVLDLNPFIK